MSRPKHFIDFSEQRPIRLILADDHKIVLQGILALFQSEKTLNCVATAANTNAILPLLDEYRPDMLLLDLCMPGIPSLDLVRKCRTDHPQLKVIVLSMHTSAFSVSQALKAGAHGFAAKSDPIDDLLRMIWKIAAGEEGISTVEFSDVKEEAPDLTDREYEVMCCIANGMSTKEISAKMYLSEKTVELYRTRLLRKFGLSKATELVRVALQSGILPSSSPSESQ